MCRAQQVHPQSGGSGSAAVKLDTGYTCGAEDSEMDD